MLTVEVKATGKCVTRNGEYPIEAVRVELSKDGRARLGFVSSRLHRNLHAGTTIDAGAMDRLALKWAKARGLIEPDEARDEVQDRIDCIEAVKGELTALQGMLEQSRG